MVDQEKERENELDEKKRLLEEFEKEDPEEIISSQEDPTPEDEIQTDDPDKKDDDLLVVIEGEQEQEPATSEPDHGLTGEQQPPSLGDTSIPQQKAGQEQHEETAVTAGEKDALTNETDETLEGVAGETGRARNKIFSLPLLRKVSSVLVLIIGLYWCFLGSQNHSLRMLVFAFLLIASGLFYLDFKAANNSE